MRKLHTTVFSLYEVEIPACRTLTGPQRLRVSVVRVFETLNWLK